MQLKKDLKSKITLISDDELYKESEQFIADHGTLSKTQIEGLKNIVNTFTYTNDVLNFIKKQASKKRVYEDFFKALELKIMDLKKRIKKHELLAEVSINKKDYELVEMTLIRELILHLVAENIYRESY